MTNDELLDYIETSVRTRGFPPTIREIAQRFNRSISTVHERLRLLIAEGLITTIPGSSRTLRVARPTMDATTEEL